MRRLFIACVAFAGILSACSDNDEKRNFFKVLGYDNTTDIVGNMKCLFDNAEAILGKEAALLEFSGVQQSDVPGKGFSLNWYCTFVKGKGQLNVDITNKTMELTENNEQILGYEALALDAVKLDIPLTELWKKCVEDNEVDLYMCEVFRPLTWPKLDYLVFNGWKEKKSASEPNRDYFSYNANTGIRIVY